MGQGVPAYFVTVYATRKFVQSFAKTWRKVVMKVCTLTIMHMP